MKEKTKQSWYKSPWLIGWLILLIVVIAINSFMIFQSINDFPGLVVDDFYDRGQHYEDNIHQKLENNQKWLTQYKLADNISLNKKTTIGFSISDKQGNPAKVDKITLFIYRPSDAKLDFSVPMSASADNTYNAEVTFTLKGKWDLLASIIIDGTEVNYAKKIFVTD